MPIIDFKTIAEDTGAVVLTQAEYLAYLAGAAANGLPSGILTAKQLNKVVRQSSTISAVVANFMSNQTGQDVLDTDDNLATLITQFSTAVSAAGKNVIIFGATFAVGVVDGNAVRWDSGASDWAKALADGSNNDLAIGFADVTNTRVILFGLAAGLFSGLTPGVRYYLDGTTPGAITATAPNDVIYVGVAKSATDLFVDFDALRATVQAVGQCQLTKSGAALLMSPFNGNQITIGNAIQAIPSAGVSLAATSLLSLTATTTRSIASNVALIGHGALASAIPVGTKVNVYGLGGDPAYNGVKTVTASSTVSTSYACVAANEGSTADTNGNILPMYFVYAFMNAGVMTLEASITGHVTNTTNGVEIKSGDATRTFVGLCALVAGAFVDTTTQSFVRSWFNRKSLFLRNNFTAARSTTSSTPVEINAEIRILFLTFANEVVKFSGVGAAAVNAGGGGAGGEALIFLDGTGTASILPGTTQQIQVPGNGGNNQLHTMMIPAVPGEGPHMATIGGDQMAATSLTFAGGATAAAYQLYAAT